MVYRWDRPKYWQGQTASIISNTGWPGKTTDQFHKTNWDAAQRTGSRGIFIWESTDLVNWSNERLVVVEDSTAGMVWAPEALWDASQGKPTLPMPRLSH